MHLHLLPPAPPVSARRTCSATPVAPPISSDATRNCADDMLLICSTRDAAYSPHASHSVARRLRRRETAAASSAPATWQSDGAASCALMLGARRQQKEPTNSKSCDGVVRALVVGQGAQGVRPCQRRRAWVLVSVLVMRGACNNCLVRCCGWLPLLPHAPQA